MERSEINRIPAKITFPELPSLKEQTINKGIVITQITNLNEFAGYFNAPLTKAGSDKTKVRIEWRNLHHYVNINLSKKELSSLWKIIINYKRNQCLNASLLSKLMISLSRSNSVLERGFSIITIMLSDQQLCYNNTVIIIGLLFFDRLLFDRCSQIII